MKIRNHIREEYHQVKQWILQIVMRMWLVGLKQKWNRLWIRKSEFHKSLDVDGTALMYMNKEEREKYMADLVKRRNIAHNRDLT